MASFHAELQVDGQHYRVVRCTFSCTQDVDARGRTRAKVRHQPLALTLDVPDHDALLAWAQAPNKPLAGRVVFFDMARQVAHETIAFDQGHCVGYHEAFESGAGRDGSYVCRLTIAATTFELLSGGPGSGLGNGLSGLGGGLGALATVAQAAIGGGGPASVLPAAAQAVGGGEALGAAAGAADQQELAVTDLLAVAKAVNPDKGLTNCADIATAVIARLRGTDPTAVAADTQTQTIPQIEATHNVKFDFGHDFHQAFDTIRNSPEGTIGLLVMVPKVPGMGHIVTIANNGGVPTIIEGQHWDAYNPVETLTSPTRAERRYGDPDQVHLGLAIVPRPAPAEPPV